ncbi:MAG TPA: type IV pilin protein [Solimonas sp.]
MNAMTPRAAPHHGFTLIELMIVVVVIGVLAAIAYPSYMESVRKSRRADAQAALVGLAAAMERHMVTNNGSYLGTTASNAQNAAPVSTLYASQVPLEGGKATYNLRVLTVTATNYTLAAVLSATGAQKGDKCGDLRLNARGQQTIANNKSGVTVADCWRR